MHLFFRVFSLNFIIYEEFDDFLPQNFSNSFFEFTLEYHILPKPLIHNYLLV